MDVIQRRNQKLPWQSQVPKLQSNCPEALNQFATIRNQYELQNSFPSRTFKSFPEKSWGFKRRTRREIPPRYKGHGNAIQRKMGRKYDGGLLLDVEKGWASSA